MGRVLLGLPPERSAFSSHFRYHEPGTALSFLRKLVVLLCVAAVLYATSTGGTVWALVVPLLLSAGFLFVIPSLCASEETFIPELLVVRVRSTRAPPRRGR